MQAGHGGGDGEDEAGPPQAADDGDGMEDSPALEVSSSISEHFCVSTCIFPPYDKDQCLNVQDVQHFLKRACGMHLLRNNVNRKGGHE